MEKRFKKIVTNPETGRKKTVRYGQAGKAADGGDRIRPGTAKGIPIALGLQKSRVIGNQALTHQTTCHAANGSAEEANQ